MSYSEKLIYCPICDEITLHSVLIEENITGLEKPIIKCLNCLKREKPARQFF